MSRRIRRLRTGNASSRLPVRTDTMSDSGRASSTRNFAVPTTEFNAGGQKLYSSPILDLHNGKIVSYETARRPLFDMVNNNLTRLL
ncbi:hypothetical protein [Paraburkholderia graminis]|uniref:hypothetical protein n=1 Tax=Paraburkholderia graminis TaxID=60548 RepID=UPI0038BB088B